MNFMNTSILALVGMWEAIIIMLVVLVFFGAKKLPEMARGLGQGIKEFKKASREVTEDFNRVIDEDQAPASKPKAIAASPENTQSGIPTTQPQSKA
jgi:sec-independent protein translocase protein TatA